MKRSIGVAALLAISCVASSHSESTKDAGYPKKLTAGSRVVSEGLATFTGADSILDTSARSTFKFKVDAAAQEIRSGVWRYEYQVTPLAGARLAAFGLDTPQEAKLGAPKGWSTATSWEGRSHVAVWNQSTESKGSGKVRFTMESSLPPRPVACFGEPLGGGDGRMMFDTGSTGLTLGPGRATEPGSKPQKRSSVVATPPPGSAAVGYQIHRPGEIQLIVADSTGATIAVLADRNSKPGTWETRWNGLGADNHPVSPGQYSFRLKFNGREVSSAPVFVPR